MKDHSINRRGAGFWIAAGWLTIVVGSALLAPLLPLAGPGDTDVLAAESGPSLQHWFGTDSVGRDVLSRTVWGARTSLVVGVLAIAVGAIVGGFLGLVAGYVRGAADAGISYVFDSLLAFPALVFAILVTALTERSLLWVTAVLAVLAVAPMGRLARGSTLTVVEEPFVLVARALGASHWRVITRELLPNVAVPLGAFALLGCGIAIVAEGSLAFLGLSVANGLSWGTIIVDGSSGRTLRSAPHVALLPITVLFLTVFSLNWIGDTVRRRADGRSASE
jgi:peptide/nickel transport system permease protein